MSIWWIDYLYKIPIQEIDYSLCKQGFLQQKRVYDLIKGREAYEGDSWHTPQGIRLYKHLFSTGVCGVYKENFKERKIGFIKS